MLRPLLAQAATPTSGLASTISSGSSGSRSGETGARRFVPTSGAGASLALLLLTLCFMYRPEGRGVLPIFAALGGTGASPIRVSDMEESGRDARPKVAAKEERRSAASPC